MRSYLVIGRYVNGATFYYTGKAGEAFVSQQLCDAFTYTSLAGARKRAAMLNLGMELHGYRFFVPVGEGE